MFQFKLLPITASILSVLYVQGVLAADDPTVTLESVVVFGQKVTRQVSQIGQADIAATTAGSSPLKALSKLPGVNLNSADTLGAYEWGTKISIRGFNQNQLGFTLDDIPLGDMSYRNYNGLHISRAISSENISKAEVSQGAGALGTASTSNLGGTVQFYSSDPANKSGVTFEQTLGSHSDRRTFARYDTGILGDSATKLSFSATDQNTDKWKGPGSQKSQQFNSKLVTNFDNAKLSVFLNWSDRKEADYMDLSKDSVARLGYNWDYYGNWQQAINSANGIWANGETSSDDAYFGGSGLRTDWLTGVTLNYLLNDAASIKSTIYYHNQLGTGTWWLPNPPTVGAIPVVPVALRTLEFDINRTGILSALTIDSGIHTFNAGVWYEYNAFNNAMRFYSQDNGPTSEYERPSNPYFTRWDYQFQTNTLQLHAQDTLKLSDQLTVNVGFKSPHTTTSVKSYQDTATAFLLNGSLTASKAFLPQAGVNFKLDLLNELFADVAQNLAAYRGVVKGGASPFDTSQAGFDAIKGTIKPEESTTLEGGWRHRNEALETSLTAYHVEFKNRLLALQQGSAIAGNASVLANVGKVETNGIEVFAALTPIPNIKWSNSASYNNSQYKDDFTSNGVTYSTSGKQVVDAPKWNGSSQVSYDDGVEFAHIGVNYIGKRYYTFVNDNSVDAYSLWDLGGGYRWKQVGPAKDVSLKVGINNLFDKKYFAFGDNPFPASDPNGTSYNLLSGAPRSAFVTLSAKL